MMDFKDILDELELVIDVVFLHWESFLIITIAYTLLIIKIVTWTYKQKGSELEAIKNQLSIREEQINKEKEENRRFKDEYDKLKAEIDSPVYIAFKQSRCGDCSLCDAAMFIK